MTALLFAMFMHTTTPAPVVIGTEYGALRDNPEVVLRHANTTNAMTTTKIQPFADMAVGTTSVSYVQHIVIVNLDTTGSVCFKVTDPATACTAVTFSCLGAATGYPVPPGASQSVDFTGEVRFCAIASEASTDVSFIRAVLYAK